MSTQRGMTVALVLLVFGLLLYLSTQKPPGSGNEGPAPDVTLIFEPEGKQSENKLPAGKPLQLASLKKRVVILDFWATWCGPCKDSIPELERIYEKYKSKGLVVVGVSVDDPNSQEQVPRAKQALGITYPIMLATKFPEIIKKYGSDAIPTMYIIDKNGDIRKIQQGLDPKKGLADIDDLVDKLLSE